MKGGEYSPPNTRRRLRLRLCRRGFNEGRGIFPAKQEINAGLLAISFGLQ